MSCGRMRLDFKGKMVWFDLDELTPPYFLTERSLGFEESRVYRCDLKEHRCGEWPTQSGHRSAAEGAESSGKPFTHNPPD